MTAALLSYLGSATQASLIQILIFLVPGLIFTLIMNYISTFVQRRALFTMGKGWYLGLFGWPGTTIHEIGHAIFCLIFRHKITKLKLFDPDPETGTLGYIEHTYNPSSIYQLVGNFFIGIGPILLGTSVIYLLLYFLLDLNPFDVVENAGMASPRIYSWDVATQVCQIIWTESVNLLSRIFSWHNLATWQLYACVYLTFTIGSSIMLSPSDIRSTLKGLIVIVILIFIFNLATVWATDLTSSIFAGSIGYFLVFYTTMFLILLLDILVFVVLLLPLTLLFNRGKVFSRF
jgi:hypothetical protein